MTDRYGFYTLTNYEMVKEFNRAMEDQSDVWPFGKHLRDLRGKLIEEEFNELMDELYDPEPRREELAKELADLLYVVYGAADAFGIPIDAVFREVHKSNMSKLGTDGKPVRREDGKVMKGPNYKAPDIRRLV